MKTRNAIYRSKHEAQVALIFAVVVFFIILFSGCMRDLSPALDLMNPEWTQQNSGDRKSCCCSDEVSDPTLLSNVMFGEHIGKTTE